MDPCTGRSHVRGGQCPSHWFSPFGLLISSDYQQAVAIVLGYLYGKIHPQVFDLSCAKQRRSRIRTASHMYSAVTAANARSVLAVATVFGVPDLGSYAYEVCRQSISSDNILDWVEWIELQAPQGADQASSSSSRASTPQSVPADGQHVNGSGPAFTTSDTEGMSFGTAPSTGPTQNPISTQTKQETTRQTASSNGWHDVLSQPATSFVTQLKQDM